MRDKLERLEENLTLLKKIRLDYSLAQIENSKGMQWEIRYGLLETIQIVIDVACHLCAQNNLGSPENYGDCVRKLLQFKYLPNELGDKLLSAIGLRNLLIHQYAVIKTDLLFSFLNEINVFQEFVYAIKPYLICEGS